jgi:catechol-2,3-dioxygenase
MNPRIRALGETVLRVKDLQRVKRFYTDVIGLDVLREFDGIVFLKVSDGYGGHTQIIGLFLESLPVPFARDAREAVHLEATSLHHFALEIDKKDFDAELARLKQLGVEVTTVEHRWCRWRSLYVHDPEGNILELVCYDEAIV